MKKRFAKWMCLVGVICMTMAMPVSAATQESSMDDFSNGSGVSFVQWADIPDGAGYYKYSGRYNQSEHFNWSGNMDIDLYLLSDFCDGTLFFDIYKVNGPRVFSTYITYDSSDEDHEKFASTYLSSGEYYIEISTTNDYMELELLGDLTH